MLPMSPTAVVEGRMLASASGRMRERERLCVRERKMMSICRLTQQPAEDRKLEPSVFEGSRRHDGAGDGGRKEHGRRRKGRRRRRRAVRVRTQEPRPARLALGRSTSLGSGRPIIMSSGGDYL